MKIALLGVGHWHAGMHLDAALACECDISAVWDFDTETAGVFAARHNVRSLPSLDAVLADRPDLIVLMGHPLLVPAVASAIVSARIPMIIEKPAAPTSAGIAALADQVLRERTFVGVPFPNRFGPVFTEMSRLEGEKRLGKLGHCHFRIVNGPPQRYIDDGVGWMLDPSIGGGGALRNLGIHGIDAACSLARGSLSVVGASIGKRLHEAPVEDHAQVTLQDEAGTLYTIEAGYTFASLAPGGDFEWRIATSNAYLVDHGAQAQCTTLDDGVSRPLRPEHPSTRYRLFMADTLACLRRGIPPTVSIHDYRRAMETIDEAYGKARQ